MTTNGDAALAKEVGEEMGQWIWDQRGEACRRWSLLLPTLSSAGSAPPGPSTHTLPTTTHCRSACLCVWLMSLDSCVPPDRFLLDPIDAEEAVDRALAVPQSQWAGFPVVVSTAACERPPLA